MKFEIKNYKTFFFQYVIGICATAMLSIVGVYSHLGTYSRYIADDYCEAARFMESDSPIGMVIERYMDGAWRGASRWSNLLFSGFSELLGDKSIQLTTSSMVVVWVLGLIWSIHELRKLIGIHWPNSMDWFLGAMLGVFSLMQAPNLFQTIFWRASLMSHFMPLVVGTLLCAFWISQARISLSRPIPWPIYPFIFFVTFIVAGFSEPPVTTMVTGLSLTMLAVWTWGAQSYKKRILTLLAWTFVSAFTALLAMVFSPASTNMVQEVTPTAFQILERSFRFSYVFFADTLKTLPTPSLISLLIPALLFWLYRQAAALELSQPQKRTIWIIFWAAPFVMWILVAAGFAPSVYGQNFPVERARFLARSIMTAAIMLEGAMLGLLAQDIRFKSARGLAQLTAVVLLFAAGFAYPVRAAINIYKDSHDEYSARAQAWDQRDAEIRLMIAQGETDLTIAQFDGIYNIKELDVRESYWVNKCAARFYGVNSIRAISR